MSDFHPIIATVLASGSLIDDAQRTDDLHPTAAQYALASGDHVLMAASDATIEKAFTIGQILEPVDYESMYPDWVERIQKGYLLLRYITHLDHEGDVGWFSRSKMIGMSPQEYGDVRTWVVEDKPHNERPDFLDQRFDAYHDAMSEIEPNDVAKSATCGKCSSRNVKVLFRHEVKVVMDGSEMNRDGASVFIPTGHHVVDCNAEAKLICGDCHSVRELDKDEFKFAPDSVIGKIVNHPRSSTHD